MFRTLESEVLKSSLNMFKQPFLNVFNLAAYAEAAGEQSPVFLLHQCFWPNTN